MLIAMLSLKGSPGVTTCAVAVAARWPAPMRPILVEADPAGGDLGMRFSLSASPGLLSLAAAARGSSDPTLVWRHAQPLPGGLAVVAAPPDAHGARAALSALVPGLGFGPSLLRVAADVPDTVVIVDCGRVDAGSPVMPVVHEADVMVVLTGAGADDLAHLAPRVPEIGRWSARPVLLLSGPGHSIAEVARELGVTPMGRVPEDGRGAAVLSGRRSALRWYRAGPARSVLGQFAHEFATALTAYQPPPTATAGHSAPEHPAPEHPAPEHPAPEHPAPHIVRPLPTAPAYPAAGYPGAGLSEDGTNTPTRPRRADRGAAAGAQQGGAAS